MKNFNCETCGNRVYFENVRCLTCGSELGFAASTLSMRAVGNSPAGGGHGTYCANALHAACNWLTGADEANGFCRACNLNRTIPNLSETGSLAAWQDMERAKKRLVYSLLRFGLPFDEASEGHGKLTFDFVRHGLTGHLDGVITIDVLEADAVERERQRQLFGEPYRALLGHLRHESGHYYWKVLVEGAGRLDDFRALFGDERADYQAALQTHYAQGRRADWEQYFVSPYASAHPWEDWAETWAHYIHIVDAVDTADAEGMEPGSTGMNFGSVSPPQPSDSYREETFATLLRRWIPLSIALNSMGRCMGHTDFYPFVIPAPAYAKLDFVHEAIRDHRRGLWVAR